MRAAYKATHVLLMTDAITNIGGEKLKYQLCIYLVSN